MSRLMSGVMNEKDKDLWMDLITEASGISEAVQDAGQVRDKYMRESTGLQQVHRRQQGHLINSNGKMVSVSKEDVKEIYGKDGLKAAGMLEDLHRTYSDDQVRF